MITGIYIMVAAFVVGGVNVVFRKPLLLKATLVLEAAGIALLLIFWRLGNF